MSARKWRPGDVAMVLNEYGVWNRAICSVKPGGDVWQYGVADSTAPMHAEARHLAVIDPEDVATVDLLVDQFMGQWSGCQGSRTLAMQGVLRVMAGNPRPNEPQGTGAVVLDARGVKWIRVGPDTWQREETARDVSFLVVHWVDVFATKVLSEGVTA